MRRIEFLGLGATLALASLSTSTTAVAQVGPSPAIDQTLAPYASTTDSARLPDGRTLHLVCMGQGKPVVILTAGAGNWSNIWNKVQPAVAQKTRVCAWDRPGFGLSSPSLAPQTVDNRTTDLQAALTEAGISGPYVAVGHSLGGYESLLLKDREPSKVVGMVLVDPSFPDQIAIFKRAAPALVEWDRSNPPPFIPLLKKCAAGLRAGTLRYGGSDPDGCLRAPRPPNLPPELRAALDKASVEAAPETYAADLDTTVYYASSQLLDLDSKIAVKPGRNYGNMPLIILTAGGDDPPPPDVPADVKAEIPRQRVEWVRGHDALAALSTRGVNRIVADSTHYIHQLKPQVVIDAIDEVVDETRAAGPNH